MSDGVRSTGAVAAAVGLAGIVLLAVLAILLQALCHRTAEAGRALVSQPPRELHELRAGQLDRISTYRWVDEANGIVAIPVARAMELIVEEARRGRR